MTAEVASELRADRPDQEVSAATAGMTSGDLQHRAARGSLWSALHAALAAPLAFAANAVVARALGVADYGSLAYLSMTLGLVVQVSHFAVSSGVTQWGAGYVVAGRRTEADALLRKSLGFHTFVQLPLIVVSVLVLARHESWLVRGLLITSSALGAVFSSLVLDLTITQRSADTARVAMVSNVLLQASVSLTAVATHLAALVWAVRTVVPTLLLPLNLRLTSRARARECLRLALPRSMPEGFWRYCAFVWASGLVAVLVFSRSEVFLLTAFSTPAAVGTFALAFGVAGQVTAPVDALVAPLMPAVAGLVSTSPEKVRDALTRTMRMSSFLAASVCVVVAPALLVLIPWIYGREYAEAAQVFVALCISSCLQTTFNPLLVFTQARRRPDLVLGYSLVALAADVVLALAAIRVMGVWGAVVGSCAGFVVYFALAARAELREQGMPWRQLTSSLTAWTVAGPSLAVAMVAVILVDRNPLAVRLVFAASAPLLFAVGLRHGRALPVEDLAVVRRAVPVRARRPLARVAHLVLGI